MTERREATEKEILLIGLAMATTPKLEGETPRKYRDRLGKRAFEIGREADEIVNWERNPFNVFRAADVRVKTIIGTQKVMSTGEDGTQYWTMEVSFKKIRQDHHAAKTNIIMIVHPDGRKETVNEEALALSQQCENLVGHKVLTWIHQNILANGNKANDLLMVEDLGEDKDLYRGDPA